MTSAAQRAICRRFGTVPEPPSPGSKVGLALGRPPDARPLNALRHPADGGANGWYIWRGDEMSDDASFFAPLHVEHLGRYVPEIEPYLALPPGWRVQVAPGHEDVWFDAALLDPR